MVIQEAAEMYLETILLLSKRIPAVRSVDVANEMGYSKPTLSEKIRQLRENGYLRVAESGAITLTDTGRAIAEHTYERHTLLARMLERLGVSRETAQQDACRMEHYFSEETFEALKAHDQRHREA